MESPGVVLGGQIVYHYYIHVVRKRPVKKEGLKPVRTAALETFKNHRGKFGRKRRRTYIRAVPVIYGHSVTFLKGKLRIYPVVYLGEGVKPVNRKPYAYGRKSAAAAGKKGAGKTEHDSYVAEIVNNPAQDVYKNSAHRIWL